MFRSSQIAVFLICASVGSSTPWSWRQMGVSRLSRLVRTAQVSNPRKDGPAPSPSPWAPISRRDFMHKSFGKDSEGARHNIPISRRTVSWPSSFLNAEKSAYEWCEGGVGGAIKRALESLLATDFDLESVSAIKDAYFRDPRIEKPAQTSGRNLYKYEGGRRGSMSVSPRISSRRLDAGMYAESSLIRLFGSNRARSLELDDSSIVSAKAVVESQIFSLLDNFNEVLTGLIENETLTSTLSTSTSTVANSLISSVPVAVRAANDLMVGGFPIQTLLVFARLSTIAMDAMSGPKVPELGPRLKYVTDRLCLLSDVEFEVASQFNQSENSPLTCFLQDVVQSVLACARDKVLKVATSCKNMHATLQAVTPARGCSVAQVINIMDLGSHVEVQYREPAEFYFHEPGLFIPINLHDALNGKTTLLPETISPDVIEREEIVYLSLYRSIVLAYSLMEFLMNPECSKGLYADTTQLVPGWDLTTVLFVEEPAPVAFPADPTTLPFVFISTSTDPSAPCTALIAVRGTRTAFEWSQDFTYAQAPLPHSGRNDKGKPVTVHRGFLSVVQAIMPEIEAALFDSAGGALTACPVDDVRLVFTGHSLGGAVAQIAALLFAEKYRESIRVEAVLFAAPRVLSAEAAELFRELVNGRNVIDRNDALFYMPCYSGNSKHGFARCSRGKHMMHTGIGRDKYVENAGAVQIDVPYSDRLEGAAPEGPQGLLGEILNSTKNLSPMVSGAIRNMMQPGSFNIPSFKELAAAHLCSIACRFSSACRSPLPGAELRPFTWWCDDCPAFS